MIHRLLACVLLAITASLCTLHITASDDTGTLLSRVVSRQESAPNQKLANLAKELAGRPADLYYFKDSIATPELNPEAFTPLSFINSVAAIVAESNAQYPSEHGAKSKFLDYSCRQGTPDGFPSLLWHGSEWIADNSFRGNLKELTENVKGVRSTTKSLDFLSRHRGDFAVLADDGIYDKVRMTEWGFRTHREPYITKQTISNKNFLSDLKEGDVLMLISNKEGEDIYCIGFVAFEGNEPQFVYLDPDKGEVVVTKDGLARFFKLYNKHFIGYRWVRFTM